MPTQKKISTTEFASPGRCGGDLRVTQKKLTARRLYQVLSKYRKDFPNDVNQLTTTDEATARQFQNKVELRRREREQAPKDPLKLTNTEVTQLLAEFGF